MYVLSASRQFRKPIQVSSEGRSPMIIYKKKVYFSCKFPWYYFTKRRAESVIQRQEFNIARGRRVSLFLCFLSLLPSEKQGASRDRAALNSWRRWSPIEVKSCESESFPAASVIPPVVAVPPGFLLGHLWLIVTAITARDTCSPSFARSCSHS